MLLPTSDRHRDAISHIRTEAAPAFEQLRHNSTTMLVWIALRFGSASAETVTSQERINIGACVHACVVLHTLAWHHRVLVELVVVVPSFVYPAQTTTTTTSERASLYNEGDCRIADTSAASNYVYDTCGDNCSSYSTLLK